MRPLLHLLNVLLALPVVVLAAAFLLFGHAVSTQSWTGFFGVLLDTFVWLLPCGLLACFALLVVLVGGGLTRRFRWLASLCVALLATGSTIVVLATIQTHENFSPDELWFFAPSLACAAFCLWLATREKRRNPDRAG